MNVWPSPAVAVAVEAVAAEVACCVREDKTGTGGAAGATAGAAKALDAGVAGASKAGK